MAFHQPPVFLVTVLVTMTGITELQSAHKYDHNSLPRSVVFIAV